jgi:hypothetical protein
MTDYNQSIAALLPTALPALGPGSPDEGLRKQLSNLTLTTVFGTRIADENAARCCLAGLWLAHDFLDESHTISQDIDTPDGSYWHATMHRREPDYSNAKYWFRRVGRHPVFTSLARASHDLAQRQSLDESATFLAAPGDWDAFAFVDLCEAIARGKSRSGQLAREVARAEWQLLFDHCYRAATATG